MPFNTYIPKEASTYKFRQRVGAYSTLLCVLPQDELAIRREAKRVAAAQPVWRPLTPAERLKALFKQAVAADPRTKVIRA